MTFELASNTAGFLANFLPKWRMALSMGRSKSQQTRPRAKMLRHLSTLLLSRPESASAALVMVVTGASTTCAVMPNSLKGSSVLKSALRRSASLNESMSTITTPPGLRNLMFCLRAAGFMAISTSQLSPGVCTPLPTLT